jgi:hypothetical protein
MTVKRLTDGYLMEARVSKRYEVSRNCKRLIINIFPLTPLFGGHLTDSAKPLERQRNHVFSGLFANRLIDWKPLLLCRDQILMRTN